MADLTGLKFGRLTALKAVGKDKFYNTFWECICDCGNTCKVRNGHLTRGITKSCGCLNNETRSRMCKERNTTHGKSGTTLYSIWKAMRKRCSNPNAPDFHNYGGRGIRVCEEWNDFEVFEKWALQNGFSEGLTIERLDVNGNYEPINCEWITRAAQARNTRYNDNITFNGETHCLSEWAEILGINRTTLWSRLYNHGWNIERALTTEVKKE